MEKAKFMLPFEKPLRNLEEQLANLQDSSLANKVDLSREINAIVAKIEATKRDIYANLNAWQKVQLSRHPLRPYTLDYVNSIFEDFQELHGDRNYRDDPAMIGGTALLDGKPVMVLGTQKGRNTKDNLKRNFGCPNPEGYRKALRLMKLANKFNLPIISFVDTSGAYPGLTAEERHIAEAIAINIREMARFPVPIITIIIGEGGSGGALGIAMADVIMILENAYYSVISPEGCAAILWKDRAFAKDASEALHLTADKLLALGIADEAIPEPLGGAHNDPPAIAAVVKEVLAKRLADLLQLDHEALLEHRYNKYRSMGVFAEG